MTEALAETTTASTSARIIAVDDAAELGRMAAECFAAVLRAKPEALTVLPAGMTPLPFYAAVRAMVAAGNIGSGFTFLQLDEYCGLPDGDQRLFASWLAREVLDPLGIPVARRLCFHSAAPDPAVDVARMTGALAAYGPIDIAFVGLGSNGHIGFNEPGSAFDSTVRVVDLAAPTLATNAAYWGSAAMPERAYTLGLGDLRAARHTVMLVSGAAKAGILRRALTGPVGPDVPATYLQQQENVTIIADRAALGKE
ncbi:MAG: glucosamine-6-phosphate deaminase [Alphaproteobacteria bacterium]